MFGGLRPRRQSTEVERRPVGDGVFQRRRQRGVIWARVPEVFTIILIHPRRAEYDLPASGELHDGDMAVVFGVGNIDDPLERREIVVFARAHFDLHFVVVDGGTGWKAGREWWSVRRGVAAWWDGLVGNHEVLRMEKGGRNRVLPGSPWPSTSVAVALRSPTGDYGLPPSNVRAGMAGMDGVVRGAFSPAGSDQSFILTL